MEFTFDDLKLESFYVGKDLERRVLRVYEMTLDGLERSHAERVQELTDARNRATSEDEREELFQQEQWEEELLLEQTHVLSAMTFSLLHTQLQQFLHRAAAHLKKTHPEAKKQDKRPKIYDDYRKRFGVDVTAYPKFDIVLELHEVRNSCIHNGGKPNSSYLALPNQHFVDDTGSINITREQLRNTVGDLTQFGHWLVQELLRVRDAALQSPK